jgi:hypothetical protein
MKKKKKELLQLEGWRLEWTGGQRLPAGPTRAVPQRKQAWICLQDRNGAVVVVEVEGQEEKTQRKAGVLGGR